MIAAVETDKARNIVNIIKYEVIKKSGQIKEIVNKILKESIKLLKMVKLKCNMLQLEI